jgi:predicted ATPase
MAEVLRTKANLLLATNRAACDLVQPILFSSLEISRRQRALAWELRASCDLAQLWQRQGQNRRAFKLLQSIYGQFTEGFNTGGSSSCPYLAERSEEKYRREK